MNILITGGCGYTGSVLVEKLLTLDHKLRHPIEQKPP